MADFLLLEQNANKSGYAARYENRNRIAATL
jgi:hypothetical protein